MGFNSGFKGLRDGGTRRYTRTIRQLSNWMQPDCPKCWQLHTSPRGVIYNKTNAFFPNHFYKRQLSQNLYCRWRRICYIQL